MFRWCLDKTRLAIWDKQMFHVNAHGTKRWYLNGKCHRVNGPAVEYPNGDKSWYLNGIRYYYEFTYWNELKS